MIYEHFVFPALKLSAQPSGSVTGKVEAHIIPTINFGVSAFGGKTEAGIFVDFDGSTIVTLSASAQDKIERRSLSTRERGAEIRGRGMIGDAFFGKRSPGLFGDITDGIKGAASSVGDAVSDAAGAVKDAVTGSDAASDGSTTTAPAAADTTAPTTNGDGASFGGCADVTAGLSVNVGADADFFSLFSPSTKFSLFSKTFSLFQVRRIS